MSNLALAKQLGKFLRAPMYVAGYSQPAAPTSVVTAALTTAAATSGNGGVAVPVQVMTPTTMGFVTAAGSNRVSLFNAGITTVALTGTTDGTTGVVTAVPATAGVVVGMVLVAAFNGIPAGSVVTAVVLNTSVTFNAVSTSAATGAFSTSTVAGETRVSDALGNEVYGRLTESGGVYTLSLFSIISGIETAYTPAAALTIDFVVVYRYTFDMYPEDAAVSGEVKHVSQDVTGSKVASEILTVTALNTLSALTKPYPVGSFFALVVNHLSYTVLGGVAADVSVTGTAVTWSALNAGFNLVPGDHVVAQYSL